MYWEGDNNMCFGSAPELKPTPPTPTTANIGAGEATAADNKKQRKGMMQATGYSQNILSGQPVTPVTDKKSILG